MWMGSGRNKIFCNRKARDYVLRERLPQDLLVVYTINK